MKRLIKSLIKSLFKLFGLEIKRRDGFMPTKLKDSLDDDYNWRTYNDEYRDELRRAAKIHACKLNPGDYLFVNNVLTKQTDILPLHPNHRLLYETVMLLQPFKVVEFGCGGGDHLHNLGVLAPEIEAYGLDRAEAQLDFARQRSAELIGKIRQFDITMPFSSKLPLVDVAYTQAVIMHIHTGNGHLVALSNMFKISSQQVILMENWTSHSFLDDIKFLFAQGMIPWSKIYFYQRPSPECGNRPHLMVVSASELPFEPLTDYEQLLTGFAGRGDS